MGGAVRWSSIMRPWIFWRACPTATLLAGGPGNLVSMLLAHNRCGCPSFPSFLPFLPSSFPRVLVKPPLSPPIHRLQPITSFTPLPPRHLSPLILVAARLFVLACRTTSLRFSGLGSIGRCVWLRIGPTSARRSLLLRLSRTSDRDTLRGSTLG